MKPILINSEIVLSTKQVVSCVRATIQEVITASPRIFRSEADFSLFTQLEEGEFLKCRDGVLGVTHVAKGCLLVLWEDPLDINEKAYQTWLKASDALDLPEVVFCSQNISHSKENLAIHAILETEKEFFERFYKATQRFQFLDVKNTDEIFPDERTFFYTKDRQLLLYQSDTLLKVLLTKANVDTPAYLKPFKADLAAFYAWAKENLPHPPQEA